MQIYGINRRTVLQRADFRTAVRESVFILIKSLVMLPRLCYNIKCNFLWRKENRKYGYEG